MKFFTKESNNYSEYKGKIFIKFISKEYYFLDFKGNQIIKTNKDVKVFEDKVNGVVAKLEFFNFLLFIESFKMDSIEKKIYDKITELVKKRDNLFHSLKNDSIDINDIENLFNLIMYKNNKKELNEFQIFGKYQDFII
jgi:tRNA U34 5-carboxymethylaminomethyl modifying enzyme MnmG/GidA